MCSSDIDLECNVVVLKNSIEKFTRSTSERFDISTIILKKCDKD